MKKFSALLAALLSATTAVVGSAEADFSEALVKKYATSESGMGSLIESRAGHASGHPRKRFHSLVSARSHPKRPVSGSPSHTLDKDDDDIKTFQPTYKRKAVHSHVKGDTCHHFHALKHSSEALKHACSTRIRKAATKAHVKGKTISQKNESTSEHGLEQRTSSGYTLIKTYSGETFFDDMQFFTGADPSGGMIAYLDRDTARSEGLIGVTADGYAMMRIGQGDNGIQRSVRVSSSDTFTTGIFILDAYHMPTGCGIWPAFWTTPADPSGGWPNGGEIDLVEGVHYFSRNMYSIHAPSSCSIPEDVTMLGTLAMPDKTLQRNCDPLLTDDQGCGVKSVSNGDFGHQYNVNRGGVHAMVWDSNDGIQIYFFPRWSIPGDISAGAPDPSSWGTPQASWPATHCNPDDYFQEHVTVFSNTVCGTWGGSASVWTTKQSGQDFSCSDHVQKSSCYEYMLSGPNLSTAFWEIASLKVYQKIRRR